MSVSRIQVLVLVQHDTRLEARPVMRPEHFEIRALGIDMQKIDLRYVVPLAQRCKRNALNFKCPDSRFEIRQNMGVG